jgi:uncharacterized metal-binding protein YceD (DUF177 family)
MIPVHLHQIPSNDTLSIIGEVGVSDLLPFEIEEAGVEPVGPLRYQLEVGLSGGGLFATGSFSLPVRAVCVSCLEAFEYEIATHEFAVQKEINELSGSELVDLTPEMREDIHLLLPMHPRCILGGNKCPAQFPQRDVPSSKNSETRSVWAALDNLNPS